MRLNDTEVQAIPQGDGDPRRFQIHGDPDKPTLVHVEKSGPAFDPDKPAFTGSEVLTLVDYLREKEQPIHQQLESSVASRTAKTIGQLLNALDRSCFLDVMPVWARLLKILDIAIPRTELGVYRRYPRQSWEFQEMRELAVLALCHLEERDALHRWTEADGTLRGYALTLACGAESQIGNGDHFLRLTHNAAIYRAFAEGK